MSYILEALKKSDQQRQRGVTPTLQSAQATVGAPKRPFIIYYGLLAVILLGGGVAIGWLHPWQLNQTSTGLVQQSPISIQQQVTKNSTAAPDETISEIRIPDVSPSLDKPAKLADMPQSQEVHPLNELPLQIQQEIPVMTVQLHAYSLIPSERLVSINSIRLREGGLLMQGLRLEQITPDGMIFSYKGYRFQRGIR